MHVNCKSWAKPFRKVTSRQQLMPINSAERAWQVVMHLCEAIEKYVQMTFAKKEVRLPLLQWRLFAQKIKLPLQASF